MIVTDERALRLPCEPVRDIREGGEIARRLTAALERHNKKAQKGRVGTVGIGLAAPQIGIHKRVCVVRVGAYPIVLMNPEIVAASETKVPFKEGCLSFPGLEVTVERHCWVRVRALNHPDEVLLGPTNPAEWNQPKLLLRAVAAQHEIDHLNGVTIKDLAKEPAPV